MPCIICRDCGRRYDYDKDDFCPKCGSFNPPPDSGATRLEQEMLARFQTGQQNQQRAAHNRPGPGQPVRSRPGRAGSAPPLGPFWRWLPRRRCWGHAWPSGGPRGADRFPSLRRRGPTPCGRPSPSAAWRSP